jgi:Bacterial Ig-like domain (group 3)/Dockerin type I domain
MRFGRVGLWTSGAVFAFTVLAAGRAQAAGCPGTLTASGGIISITSQGGLSGSTVTQSSTASVSGATGPVATVCVVLNGVSFNAGADGGNNLGLNGALIDLQAPNSGPEMVLLGATGSGFDGNLDINITVQDGNGAAPGSNPNLPTSWTGSATVEPSSYWAGYDSGACPPVPAGTLFPQTDGAACPGGVNHTLNTAHGVFPGASADGSWTLTLYDVFGGPITIGSWELYLTYSAAAGTNTVISSSSNPSSAANSSPFTSSVTFTATVSSGSGTPTGTVAFSVNGTPISCSSGNQVVNGSGEATCGTSLSQGYNAIAASYTPTGSFAPSSGTLSQLVEITPSNSGNQWCNNAPITIPSGGIPLAYPALIKVTGVSNSVNNVTVTLTGVTGLESQGGTGIADAQFLLVAPVGNSGQNLDFLDSVFNAAQTSAVNLTIFDGASQSATPFEDDPPASGSYQATDDKVTGATDTFPALQSPSIDSAIPSVPATINYAQPFGGVNAFTFGQAFSGASANGAWALYLYNPGAPLSVTGGWCINFTLNSGVVTTTTISPSQNPATTGAPVTFTATVTSGGNPVTSGTVTITDITTETTLASGVSLNSSGQAATSTSSLTEGDHKIVATYSGVTGTFDPSTSFVWQRENNATTATNLNVNPAAFCNTGAILLPAGSGGPENIGAANPNPSNIFVTGLPGTINTVGITLESFQVGSTDTINNIASLLVGPNGSSSPTSSQTLDFFSKTGNSSTILSLGNYTFADSGGGLAPQSAFSPGTYKPTSYADGTPDVFFASPSGFYTLPGTYQYAATTGSSTLTEVYGNTIGNGTWSLYFDQNTHENGNGANNGWCLTFTQNPPDVSVTNGSPANSPANFTQGGTGSFNFVVTNNGPGPTGGTLTLTDTLPTGLTYASSTGTGWNCSASGQVVACTISGTNAVVTPTNTYPPLAINVNVASNAPASVQNSATISGSMDTTPGDNTTSTDTVTVLAPSVLTISKTAVGTFTQGSTADWDVTVGNSAGTVDTTTGTVSLSDTLPSGYTVSGFGTTNTTTWSCSGTGTQTATCSTIMQLAGGSSYPVIHIIVNVPAASPTSVTNTASVSGGGASNSPQTASSSPTVVQVPASVSINGMQTQSTADTTAFGSLAVTVKDAGGVVIPNYSPVVFTATTGSSGQSGTFGNNTNTTSVAANPSGIANPGTFTANTKLGAYTVGVVAGGATASFNLTNVVGAPASIAVSSGSGQSANTNSAFTNPLVALVDDAGGNPVPSASVTFAGPATGPGVSFTSTNPATTSASGLASVSVSANGTSGGPYNVTATVGSLPTSPGFSLTNNAVTVPQVVSYSVDFGVESYNLIGASRTTHLPWSIAGITVVFSEPIATATTASLGGISATSLSGVGTTTLTWTFSAITNATLATTLAGSGANAIKDGNGNPLAGGSGFSQGFSVLYGDFNGDGVVTAADLLGVTAATKQPYNIFADINGDGVVNTADATIVKAQEGATQH